MNYQVAQTLKGHIFRKDANHARIMGQFVYAALHGTARSAHVPPHQVARERPLVADGNMTVVKDGQQLIDRK